MTVLIYKKQLFKELWRYNDTFKGQHRQEIIKIHTIIKYIYEYLNKKYNRLVDMPV